MVLLSWLAVGQLNLEATQVGWLQATALLPNLAFMLLAGVWADRFNSANIIVCAYGLHALAFFSLSFALFNDALNFYLLLFYGFTVGVGNAFLQPVREKLLATINTVHVQKRFSYASIVQFSCQSVGIVFASSSEFIGYAFVVLAQGCFTLIALASMLLLKHVDRKMPSINSVYQDALEGFLAVYRSKPLSQLMILIGFNGYMHLGVYIVAVPLMARSVYDLNAMEYGGLQLTFVLGMIAAHVSLIRKASLDFPGQGALFSLLYTSVVGFALAKGPTISGFYFIVFCWGFVAGNSAGRCRLVVQALSDAAMKGRIMSIYQFVLFGFAPLGALVSGYFIKYLKLEHIFYVMSGSSAVLFFIFIAGSALANVKQAVEQEP